MLRRLLIVSIAALALASPASAYSQQDGMQTMDDGVSITFTRYTPDGRPPAGGWPGVMVLHGLGQGRRGVETISSAFAAAGYSVLAYDARGHASSGGVVTLAGPREVADLRALRQAFGARPEVSDTKIGAWGISYGGGQIWNALAAGVPFAAVEVVETWTNLYEALWPQNLARSGIVTGLAASVVARSPLVAGIADDAVQSENLAAVRALGAGRSVVPRLGGLRSITTPVYLFQGRVDFVFDITQASQAFEGLGGPKKLYVGLFGHSPSTFPAGDMPYMLAQSIAWYDRYLKGTRNGVESTKVVIAKEGSATGRVSLGAAPKPKLTSYVLPGRSVARGEGFVSRRTAPLRTAVETWGMSTVQVDVPKLVRYPRLVVTVLAGRRVVSHGGLMPHAGRNVVELANYCVYLPKGTRLQVTVGPSSPAGGVSYLTFPGSGSATIGKITLRLATLAKPLSG